MPVNILLADDHEVVRQGLRSILNVRPEWQICGEAENGQQAIDLTNELKPDILILDITMPVMSGLEAVQKITDLHLNTRVLIFTMHESRSLVKAVRKAGARGCVLKYAQHVTSFERSKRCSKEEPSGARVLHLNQMTRDQRDRTCYSAGR